MRKYTKCAGESDPFAASNFLWVKVVISSQKTQFLTNSFRSASTSFSYDVFDVFFVLFFKILVGDSIMEDRRDVSSLETAPVVAATPL